MVELHCTVMEALETVKETEPSTLMVCVPVMTWHESLAVQVRT